MSKNIDVEDLNIYYGSFLAVEGVTMSIRAQSVTAALIGPSGCGKSTFLRSINRMHEVILGARVEGKLALDGRDLYGPGVDPVGVRRQVGMVFQRPNSVPHDVDLRQRHRGHAAEQQESQEGGLRRAGRAVAAWGEPVERGQGPAGEARLRPVRWPAATPVHACHRRVARGTADGRAVLGLDPISTLAIEDLINELKQDYTIVIVTHNMQQAARVSDYTGFFNIEGTGKPGKLVEMDDTRTIFSKPTQKATEDYVSGRFG